MPVVRRFEDKKHTSEYAAYRPKYPQQLLATILNYVQKSSLLNLSGRFPQAVDVGCGPGLMSTSFLAPYFDKVLGVDISAAQIEQANIHKESENIQFIVGQGECLPVQDESVTLVQVATTLHWLDHERFYRECERVLVPGGVIAAYSYGHENVVVDHPNAGSINLVIEEMSEAVESFKNPWYTTYHQVVIDKYRDPELQIPYKDRARVEDIHFDIHTTISGFEKYKLTLSHIRNYVNSGEEAATQWKAWMERLMEAYGTDDPEAPLTYRMNVFLLMGSKPVH